MTYTCDRCKKELEHTVKTFGGYAVTEMKNLCPECWKEYIEIKNRHNQELRRFWNEV
jgi:DNA-directed RNA polymerase subunit RPC12/RpoP